MGLNGSGRYRKVGVFVHYILLFCERKNRNSKGQEINLLSLSYGRIIRKNININTGLLPESFNTYNIVEKDDIIIRPTDLQNDKRSLRTGIVKEHGIITSAYIALKPKKYTNSSYFHYLLHAYDIKKVFYNMGNGVRQGLNYSEFCKLLIINPTNQEQSKIINFLDAKCADIDSLTADIQKQIDILKEYKKSVIIQAVTKGLDPNVEMKDSGVGWVNKIPRGWKVQRLKYLCRFSKGLPITKADLKPSGKAVINYGQVHAKFNTGTAIDERLIRYVDEKYLRRCPQSICHKNDFIFADTSEDYEGAGNCVFVNTDNFVFAGYHTFIASLTNYNGNPKFLAYLFQSDTWRKQIRSKVSGIKVYSITQTIMKNIDVIYPQELDCQNKIVDFLDAKCADIDAAIAGKQKQLDVLKEYKKSLIYEHVTGKKEVPCHE